MQAYRTLRRALTLPSNGHTTAGHNVSLRQEWCRRCVPLMSNVRPRRMSRTTRALVFRRAASQEAFGQRCRAAEAHLLRRAIHPSAAGEPSTTGAKRCSVLSASTCRRSIRTDPNAVQSASALEAPPRVNVGQFVGASAVAPARSASSRSQWCRFRRSGPVVVAAAVQECCRRTRPNPSIEGTSNSRLRRLSAAPHVKR